MSYKFGNVLVHTIDPCDKRTAKHAIEQLPEVPPKPPTLADLLGK